MLQVHPPSTDQTPGTWEHTCLGWCWGEEVGGGGQAGGRSPWTSSPNGQLLSELCIPPHPQSNPTPPAQVSINAFDPIGNSPVMIHKAQFASIVDSWVNLTIAIKQDPEADREFGWVQEM